MEKQEEGFFRPSCDGGHSEADMGAGTPMKFKLDKANETTWSEAWPGYYVKYQPASASMFKYYFKDSTGSPSSASRKEKALTILSDGTGLSAALSGDWSSVKTT